MCGILGQVSKLHNKKQFENSLQKIKYRGPDHSAVCEYGDVLFGHNRLAIIDLDPRSNQPFIYKERYALIFNGEIFNFKEIKEELLAAGYSFRTQSDTEVILAAFDKWRLGSFIRFHGQFSIAILDQVEHTVTLARDRFGEKPMFYSHGGRSGLVFGSELKAVLSLLSQSPTVDETSIIDYLHFGFVPAPKSIYKEIQKLPPAHYLVYSNAEQKIRELRPYYEVTFNPSASKLQDRIESFHAIGRKVASQISLSDVSLGAFLSGGVDSSGAVVFLKQIDKKVNTFTVTFENESFDESIYASKVANHLNVPNTQKKVSYSDFEETYDKMVELYDEPFNDHSFIPTYYVCREARAHHTVMISGDGADEIFCGYRRYHKVKQFQRFANLPFRKPVGSLFRLLPTYSNLRRQGAALALSDIDFYFYLLSLNFTPDLAPGIYGQNLAQQAKHYSPRSVIENHLAHADSSLPMMQKLRYLDIKMTLPEDMLVKVDRASMLNSLEVRPFYLHPLVTDFAFALAPDELVNGHIDKYFLKKSLEKDLPEEILYRRKMGFTFPLKELILTDLKGLFESSVRNLPAELINTNYISALTEMHKRGNRDFTPQLHSLMFLGAWLKRNNLS